MYFKDYLKACTCCGRIKIPGRSGSVPFLQAAESILSDFFNEGNHLELSGPLMFPPVIKKIGDQEQRGFTAEYEVYQKLKSSNLPMYVFYSLKASHKNEELGDFILVTKCSVIVLEVKAFKLAEYPSEKDLNILVDRLSKQYEHQRLRVLTILEKYLLEHGGNNASLSVKYFILFANTMRPNQKNLDLKNAVFKDDYMKTIVEIIATEKEAVTEDETDYSVRTLLAWFYGTYASESYIEPNKLVHHDSIKARKELDQEYIKNKKDIDGVFLTPAQIEVVSCNQNYLQITGAPGTGKTYCLLAKMVQVFLKLWKEVDGNPRNSNELILFIHENEEMLIKIRESFWNSIDKRIGIHDSMKKLVKFAYSAYFVDFDRSDESILKIPGKDKIFKLFLDDTVDFSDIRRMSGYDPMLKLTSNSNFCWFTTYTILPSLQTLLRPFSLLEIKDDAIHEICQYACLTDTLRFTASIHDLTDAVLSSISTHRYLQWDDLRTRVEIINGYNGYKSGTRVVGVPCDLYQVQSHSDMVDKVVAIVEAYVTTGKFRIDDIAVVKISEYFDTVNMTIGEMENITHKKEEQFLPSLRQRLIPILIPNDLTSRKVDNYINSIINQKFGYFYTTTTIFNDEFVSLKDIIQSPERLRGLERECVIVCVLESLSSPENQEPCLAPDLQALQAFRVLEAITRANSAVTVFYLEGNQQIKTVHENLQNKIPSVSPSDIYRKQNSSVMCKHQPQKLMSFLIDDTVQVMKIFFLFHTAYHKVIGQEKLYCDLRCVGHLKSNMRFEVSSTVTTAFWDLYYLTILIQQTCILIKKSANTHCSDTLKILLKDCLEKQILIRLTFLLKKVDVIIPEIKNTTTLSTENFDTFDLKYFNLCRIIKSQMPKSLDGFGMETKNVLNKIHIFVRNYELLRKVNLEIEQKMVVI